MRDILVRIVLLCLGLAWADRHHHLQPTDTSSLSTPLIVDPNAPSASEQSNIQSIVSILEAEPSAAEDTSSTTTANGDAWEYQVFGTALNSLESSGTGTAASSSDAAKAGGAGGDGGGAGSSNSDTASSGSTGSSSSDTTAIQKEIILLTSLINHGQEIAKQLPAKQQRLNQLKAELNAAMGNQASQDAQQQLGEQQALQTAIQAKITELQQKLQDLQTTDAKLQASIDKVKAAVATNSQVTQKLNQAAAVASVGGPDAASGTTSGSSEAAPTTATPAASASGTTSFLEKMTKHSGRRGKTTS